MPRLSSYVLRQLAGPVLLFAFLLTCVVWLSQSLRLLDLVINRGQSAPTFVYLTLLILPGLLVIILPLSYFAGTLYGLHRLNSESELVVMQAAGYSQRQLALPVMALAVITMALVWLCNLYLMPLSQRTMKDAVLDIRADIGAAILNEGDFNTPINGLTVFIRELGSDGNIKGILVHDSRDARAPTTYIAQSGLLVQTPLGARLIMKDGTIEQASGEGAKLSVLKFKSYVFDLDQFGGKQTEENLETSERYLTDLFWPQPNAKLTKRTRDIYLAEGHNRLSAPFYCIAFGLIAMAAVTRGRRGRGAYALRLTAAAIAAAALRLLGYVAQGMASRNPPFCVALYLIPLMGAGAALLDLAGFEFAALLDWIRPRRAETAQ
ncbi:MAG TPA: LPS export ABC transporter permease LptF [Rhizomicrobium sp.]|nr:LPS export ABC transporter permease LptF [Rhizomicrobium sp.]